MTSPPVTQVRLLDGFAICLEADAPVRVVEDLPKSAQRLVAHLCFTHRPGRTAVAGQLWPDVPEEHAHGSLRSALWRVHKLAPGLVEVHRGAIGIAPWVCVDVHELDAWVHRALDPRSDLDDVGVPGSHLVGDLLPGWYDDWVLLERERLRQLRLHALEVVAERFAREGRHAEALHAAFEAIRGEPLRESAHRTVVSVHLAEGNVAEAVRAFEVFANLLRDELGVGPTERMLRLVAGLPRRRITST
jgi:DNA-binding SARP family transcriptional activator